MLALQNMFPSAQLTVYYGWGCRFFSRGCRGCVIYGGKCGDLPVDMSQNAASTLADKWNTAKENNDTVALMELEKQITEWVDKEQRTQSLEYSYAKRENLDGFDFTFPFGKKTFLNDAISSWIPEE